MRGHSTHGRRPGSAQIRMCRWGWWWGAWCVGCYCCVCDCDCGYVRWVYYIFAAVHIIIGPKYTHHMHKTPQTLHTCQPHQPPHALLAFVPKTPTTTAMQLQGCFVNHDQAQPPQRTHDETTPGGGAEAPPPRVSPAAPRCLLVTGAPPPHSTGHTPWQAMPAVWVDVAARMCIIGVPCLINGMLQWLPQQGHGCSCWPAGQRLQCCSMPLRVVLRGLQCVGHVPDYGMQLHVA